MPSFDVRLTWAQPVDPVRLIAHFEACRNLEPAICALRISSRFDTRAHTSVTKLPVEMLALIDEYMIEDERQRTMKHVASWYRCWNGQCRPVDHLSDETCREIFEDYVKEVLGPLKEDVRTTVNTTISSVDARYPLRNGFRGWKVHHEKERKAWLDRARDPQSTKAEFSTS